MSEPLTKAQKAEIYERLKDAKNGLQDALVLLRDLDNRTGSAAKLRDLASELSSLALLVGGGGQRITVNMTMARDAVLFGCKTIGFVEREDCRDSEEEWRRLSALASSKGYEILSHRGNLAVVRLPP